MPAPRFLQPLLRWLSLTPEDVSQDPSRPLFAALGSPLTPAGNTITEATADSLPAVYACNRVISEAVAQLPLKLMRRLSDGSKVPAPEHPLYTVLHDLANPEMTAFEFREALQTSLNYYGNAYAEVQRDARGQVKALWPLDPSRMYIVRDTVNTLTYRYKLPGNTWQVWRFNASMPPILHIRINTIDGIHGRSPIRVLRDTMGLTKAAQDFGARFFGNSARPSGVLTTPNTLSDEAASRLARDWAALHSGPEMAHRVAVLEQGTTFAPIGIPPEDAQFLETRKFQRSEIAGAFRVPLHMIGDLERATFSNIEHQAIEFVQHTLLPHLIRWQQAIARDLLGPVAFERYTPVFIVDGLLRGDIQSRYNAYAIARQNGWMSANDIRRKEDENLLADSDGGDTYLVNGNMLPISMAAGAVAPAAAPAAAEDDEDEDEGPVM